MPRGKSPKSPIIRAIAEIRDYLAKLDQEIAQKQAERDELRRELAGVPVESVPSPRTSKKKRTPAATEGGRGRMSRKLMQAALDGIQKSLTKGEEYTREQVASASKIPSENLQSVLLRAKAKKILKSNGQRGRGGRWMLA